MGLRAFDFSVGEDGLLAGVLIAKIERTRHLRSSLSTTHLRLMAVPLALLLGGLGSANASICLEYYPDVRFPENYGLHGSPLAACNTLAGCSHSISWNDAYSRNQCTVQCAPGIGTWTVLINEALCTKPSLKNLKNTCLSVGDPIHIGTGDEWQIETDYIDARRMEFTRYYHSISKAPAGSFGAGWRHTYDRNIEGIAGRSAWVTRANGAQAVFAWSGQSASVGQWTSDTDTNEKLTSQFNANGDITGWQLVLPDGQVEIYNEAGRLIKIVDERGYVRNLTYAIIPSSPTVAPKLVGVTDSFGRSQSFIYDAQGRLSGATNPAGGQYQYSYDSNGNLSSATYPDGKSRGYLYNEAAYTSGASLPSSLTGVVDENGNRYSTISYDATGRAISSVLAGGVDTTSLTYNSDGSTTVTDPLNTPRIYRFNKVQDVLNGGGVSQPGGSGCAASSSASTHDVNGNLASQDDFNGVRSCFAYDMTRNLQTSRVDGLSNTANCQDVTSVGAPLPAGSRKTSTAYHPDWKMPVRIAEPGKLTTYIYNGQPDPFAGNALINCAQGAAVLPNGLPVSLVCKKVEQATSDMDGSQGLSAAVRTDVLARQYSWTYNAAGQILTARGPRTDVDDTRSYGYYTQTDGAATTGDLKEMVNALGHVTRFNAYNANGQVLQSSDVNGVVTAYTYDLRQRPTSIAVAGLVTGYAYDAAGQLTSITAPDGTVNRMTYDSAHRLTQIEDGSGNKVVYTLDAAGNRIGEQVQDSGGALLRNITRSFDALSRLQGIVGDVR